MTRSYPDGGDHEDETPGPPAPPLALVHARGRQRRRLLGLGDDQAPRVRQARKAGPQGVIVTRNDWVGPDGKKQCEDERTLTFGADGDSRWIDFDVTVKATDMPGHVRRHQGRLIRRCAWPATMKVDAKLGGQIVNSEGQTDKDAWGKQAAWVDYHGPVDGQTVGIAIFNHPSELPLSHLLARPHLRAVCGQPFRAARLSGLQGRGRSATFAPGESFTLRYRVLLHKGDEKAGPRGRGVRRIRRAEK